MSNFISNKSKPENISLIALCLTPISFVTGSLMANAFTVILFLVCILNGQKNFLATRAKLAEHPVEKVGANLRAMMPWIGKKKLVDSDKG